MAILTCQRDRPDGLALYIDRQPTDSEVRANYTGAKFEPKWGCFLGAYIDQDQSIIRTYRDDVGRIHRYPVDFESKVGKSHATYFFYMGYGMPLAKDWIAKLKPNKIVHIALEPNRGLEHVFEDRYLLNLAKELSKTGAKIFLRFASEMNGNWVAYGLDSDMYRAAFERVADVMHREAPNVAMVWCPYASPTRNIVDYYPGDKFVDWVGVNFYNVTYFNQDRRQPAWNVHPTDMLDHVYDLFSHKKPIIIAEYGATHFSALENEDKTSYAIRCIRSLYQALPKRYPRVKAIDYFDANNLEIEHAKNNDYSLTNNPLVLQAYRDSISPAYFLGDSEPTSRPSTAMPLERHQRLRGTHRISGWIRATTDLVLRLSINGQIVLTSRKPGDWQATIDFTKFPNGPTTLVAEASDDQGRVAICTYEILIEN